MAGYIGEYLKLYHHFPTAFQTTQFMGLAYPTLYGMQLYRIAGALSAIAGPDLGIRIVACGAALFAVGLVYRATRRLGGSRPLGILAALTVSCSTYALTNLYDRSDLAEYVAVELLTGALAALFATFTANDLRERWVYRLTIAAAWILILGSHVISEVFGGIFFTAVVAVLLLRDHRRPVLVTIGCTIAGMSAGALWQALAFWQLHGLLALPTGLTFFPDSIDSPLERFAPIPFDIRMLLPAGPVSTPYLEAPLDYGFLTLTVAALFFARSRIVLAMLSIAAVFLIFSLSRDAWHFVPPFFQLAQFAYRLTSYINLSLLAAFFAMLWRRPQAMARVERTPVPWVIATSVVLVCLVKMTHIAAIEHPVPAPAPAPQNVATYESLPATFYGPYAYIVDVSKASSASPPHVAPPPVPMQAIGAPATQSVVADGSGFVYTRILAFPWNVIVVDGKPIPDDQKIVWKDQATYGFRMRPGSRHDMSSFLELPRAIAGGMRLAEIALALDLAVVAALIAWLILRPEYKAQAEAFAGTAVPS